MADKKITIQDFLTDDQIEAALTIWQNNTIPAKEIAEKVIRPAIAEINKKLGQENDPLYLAYCCEYVFNETQRRK